MPGHVEFHLPFVAGVEAARLEFDGNQRSQRAVEEEQVQVVVVRADGHPLLAGDEAEPVAELEQKRVQLPQERGLQLGLAEVREGPGAPTLDTAELGVEPPFERVVDGDELAEVGPAQLSTQCVHNLYVGKSLYEVHHVVEVASAEPTAELGGQRVGHLGDDNHAVIVVQSLRAG
jgi:hypothetical protein